MDNYLHEKKNVIIVLLFFQRILIMVNFFYLKWIVTILALMKRVFCIVESFTEVNISIVSVYVFSAALTKFLYIS
jgi:hypothetical protein